MTGRLIAIARRPAHRAPMEEIEAGEITLASGLGGDFKGSKYPRRQLTVLGVEDWQAAVAELQRATGAGRVPDLAWTVRRANLLIEGLRLPRARGAVLRIGAIEMEVMAETLPCARMDEAMKGLRLALAPEWRGGVTGRVRHGGMLRVGDEVTIVSSPPERTIRLPG